MTVSEQCANLAGVTNLGANAVHVALIEAQRYVVVLATGPPTPSLRAGAVEDLGHA